MTAPLARYPVFVSPTFLNFYTLSTAGQLLTIYNQNPFAVKYDVTCTAIKNYRVVDSVGKIQPHSAVSVPIRHVAPSIENCNIIDKFKITLKHLSGEFLGTRIIKSCLLDGEFEDISNDEDMINDVTFQNVVPEEILSSRETYPSNQTDSHTNRFVPGIEHIDQSVIICVLICLICILLCLNTKCEAASESITPSYLQLSANIKIGLSFLLGGLITYSFMKIVS